MNIIIYTNILTPYRKYFYDLMYEECRKAGDNFYILVMSETESDRNWNYEDLKGDYTILLNSLTFNKGSAHIHYNNDLKSKLELLKPDVVICAGSYLCPGTWTIARLKNKLNYKCIYWSESHLNEKRNYGKIILKFRDLLRKKFYESYDGFWYAGEKSKEFIKKYALSETKYFFMPNLVENKRYLKAIELRKINSNKLKKEMKIDLEKFVFICPARLIAVKGICEFLEILNKSKIKNKFTILLAGDGELKEKIKDKSIEYEIDIRILGFIDQNKMIELYAIADALLLPSLSDANPLTCIESLWAGLSLFISSHCGNYPEVIEKEKNGYVFDYKNEREALKFFEELVNKPKKWKEEAQETSLKIAETFYNPELVVNRVLKEIKNFSENK